MVIIRSVESFHRTAGGFCFGGDNPLQKGNAPQKHNLLRENTSILTLPVRAGLICFVSILIRLLRHIPVVINILNVIIIIKCVKKKIHLLDRIFVCKGCVI